MSLEVASFISELDTSNPPGTDQQAQGDDHLRLIKTALQSTFPNASKAFRFPTTLAKAVNYSVLSTDENTLIPVDATGGAITLTLPLLATAAKGFRVGVVKVDSSANSVTVDGNASDTINDVLTDVIHRQYEVVWYIWDGTEWWSDHAGTVRQVITKSATGNLTVNESGIILVDTTGGSVTLTLPAAASSKGRYYYVKKLVAANTFTLEGDGAETIDGAANIALNRRYNALLVVGDGDEWHLVGLYYDAAQVSYLDAAQTWALLQTFTLGATFNGPVSTPYTTLTDAATIAWDLATGSNFKVTLGASRTLGAFSNGVVGQRGTLQVIQDGTGGWAITFNAAYDFAGGVVQRPSPGAGEITLYDFEVTGAAAMKLTRKWVEGQNSIGHYKEYTIADPFTASTTYTQAHGLARNPGLVEAILECKNIEEGYAVGDQILATNLSTLDSGGGSNSHSVNVGWNVTNIYISTGNNGIGIVSRTNQVISALTAANWKLLARVYE